MQLHEILKNCLWALDSRDPQSVLDINEAVLGPQRFLASACPPSQVIELLQINTPQVLYAPARIVIDQQEQAIYLLEHSQETPAFWIRPGGSVAALRAKQLQMV